MYLYLPYHLKIGTMKWNQTEISFDNNSTIATESFSPTAGLGKTINFLILDEFAWCPPNDVELLKLAGLIEVNLKNWNIAKKY